VNRALRAATVGVLLLSPVALSACSAGQITQTGTQVRDKAGAQAQVGDISIREATLAYPTGGSYSSGDDAALEMAIANNGSQDDTLTKVSGTGFSSAVFTAVPTSSATGTPTGTTASGTTAGSSPTGAPTTTASSTTASSTGASSTGASSTGAATSTPAGSTSASGSASASAGTSASSSAAPTELPIPAGGTVFVGQDAHITLTGLDSSLTTGQYVTVVLTFAKAGEVTLKVTVANPSRPISRDQSFDFKQGGE
jgi:copper(I)-binding protein